MLHMKLSLQFLFGLTAWTCIATYLGTFSGQKLGYFLAISFAVAATLAYHPKYLASFVFAGITGALGMTMGQLLHIFVVPWPAWVGPETRTAIQRFTADRLLVFTTLQAVAGLVCGVLAAFATMFLMYWMRNKRITNLGPIALQDS